MLTARHPRHGSRRTSDYERMFIRRVVVRRLPARDAAVVRFLAAGWVVIAAKCVAVTWAIHRWTVPFHPAWIIGPTLLMAALGTALYWRRR